MDSPDLVRATPYFILLSVGNATLLFIVIYLRECGLKPQSVPSQGILPGIQVMHPLVLALGFLTAFSGVLGLVGLGLERVRKVSSAHVWFLGQESLEIIIRLLLGGCVLYLLDHRILLRHVSEMPIGPKALAMHNVLLVFCLACSTILSYISICVPLPIYVPPLTMLITCWLPLPLIIHFVRRPEMSPSTPLRIWITLALVQLSAGISSCFVMVSGYAFAIVHAALLALWVGGMMFVFQMLHVPLVTAPYERQSPTGTASEDFLSLRDPFMLPPPVSPDGTHLRFPTSTFTSSATITALSSIQGSQRPKSTTSLPLLSNAPTSTDFPGGSQPYRGSMQERSRQRRVNSEPLRPLTRQPDHQVFLEQTRALDSGGESLDRGLPSKIGIHSTNNHTSHLSQSTSITEAIDSHTYWSNDSLPHTMTEKLRTENIPEASQVEQDIGVECDCMDLEAESGRQWQCPLNYGPSLKPCSKRPSSPNLWCTTYQEVL